MKRPKMPNLSSLIPAVLLLAMTASAPGLEIGVGLSQSKDPQAAGAEAARQAKTALGDQKPKLVLVFNSMALKQPDQIGKMLAGVASVFDASVVYGCCGYAPLTQHGSEGTVGVMALGGDVRVAAACAKVEGKDGQKACGEKIGQALREAAQAKAAGQVLLLFGDCHIPANEPLVRGVCGVLGEKLPVVGGSSSGAIGVYEKGKFVPNANLGILIQGDFRCGLAIKKDNSPQGLIDSARAAFTEAIGPDKDKLAAVLVFDCGGRRGMMLKNKNYPKELEAMKGVAGSVPIFGFYGSGEIGQKDCDTPACGVGYHISACAIITK